MNKRNYKKREIHFGIKERGAVKKGDTLIEIQHKATMERLLGQKPQGA